VSREWSPRGPKGIKYSFQKGDVIIPEDKIYPEMALEVTEMLPNGEFRAVPVGGGFVLRFGPEKMAKYRFRRVPASEMQPQWRRGKFWIEGLGLPELEGWTTGELWNGWATPVFEKREAEIVLKQTDEMYFGMGEKFKWSYNTKTDTFTHQSEHDEELIKNQGAMIQTPEGPKKVYAIGTSFWTWSEK
jgi:hypothetical protein